MPRRGTRRDAAQPPEPPEASDGAAAAMEIAVRFLGTRPRTRWELDRRLRRAGVGESIVDATLDRLAEMGYVDDAAFARWWGEQRDRHGPRGRRMIEAELRQHGIGRDVIETYRGEHAAPERRAEDESLPGSEAERAQEALERHLRGRPLPTDVRALQRVGMFLVRRGFDPDVVRSTIRAAGSSPTTDELS